MTKNRLIKYLLAGLYLWIVIPAFAEDKYFVRVSNYMDSLGSERNIDSVSNLCKKNPTYGQYATGEHTYPATLPRVGINVKCFMEHPNPAYVSFGMDVHCPKGFSHRSMDGIEHGLEEGCYSLMTCTEARKKGEFPLNAPICDGKRLPNEWGGVACTNDTDFTPCFWPEGLTEGDDEKDHVTDPAARHIMSICIVEHERAHIGNVGQVCWENRHRIWGGRNTAIAEINSFNIELACYAREKQCCEGNRNCLDQVEYRMDRVQVMIDYYNAQLGP